MRRIVALICALIMVISVLFLFSSCSKTTKDIAIIYTNDIHAGIDDNLGLASVAALKKEMIEKGYDTLLVDSGDLIQGSNYGTMTKGEDIINIMNKCGYDLATIGNHDFDFGVENLLKLTKLANFEYVCCNFVNLKTGEYPFKPYVVKECGGRRIAFIGIATPETITTSTPVYFKDENGDYAYGFFQGENGQKFFDRVQEVVNKARAEGVDYVIAISHLGTKDSSGVYRSNYIIENTSGIDVFLDAHSHSVIESEIVKNAKGEDVILTQTGTKLETIGRLTISKDGTVKTELITEYEGKDETVAQAVAAVKSKFDSKMSEVIGHSDFALSIYDNGVRIVRNNDTGIGNFVADAYRTILDADIAIVNSGGIRTSIESGEITYEELFNVHPFANNVAKIKIKGSELANLLEYSVRGLPSENGGFLQVSGITFDVDLSVDSIVQVDDNGMMLPIGEGERRVKNIKVGGANLDPEKIYTLASTDYVLLNGGDGYVIKNEGIIAVDEITDLDVLVKYLKETLGGVVPGKYNKMYGEGRIVKAVPVENGVIDERLIGTWVGKGNTFGYLSIFEDGHGIYGVSSVMYRFRSEGGALYMVGPNDTVVESGEYSINGITLVFNGVEYINSSIYDKDKETSDLTISIDKLTATQYGFTLSETKDFSTSSATLNVDFPKDMTNISEKWLPADLDNIDGEHNGDNYVAYTFYLKNAGNAPVAYYFLINMVSAANNLDEIVRVRIYVDGDWTNYAKPSSNGSGAEPGTTAFITDQMITQGQSQGFNPGDVTKFTIVIWIEGDDPDCTGDYPGGRMQISMDIGVK